MDKNSKMVWGLFLLFFFGVLFYNLIGFYFWKFDVSIVVINVIFQIFLFLIFYLGFVKNRINFAWLCFGWVLIVEFKVLLTLGQLPALNNDEGFIFILFGYLVVFLLKLIWIYYLCRAMLDQIKAQSRFRM